MMEEEQLFILCSFDDEKNNINADTRYIDVEHCKNCFEIKKCGGYDGHAVPDPENTYIITNVYKNSFGQFEVNDIIHILYGYMITIENISKKDNNIIDIYPIILFEKDSIQFYSEEIEKRIAELEKRIQEKKYPIYTKILDCILDFNENGYDDNVNHYPILK
jgi:hypothetical protein